MNRNLTREELLEAQYAMLKEIHNCCVANGIIYYLAYGTLIGAVRHKGFIPWDDDVDIMMTEDEYERLRRIYKSDRYFISDCFHEKKHPAFFPRMYDSYTCTDNDNQSLGVYVDIYIIHGSPDNQFERAKHVVKLMRLQRHIGIYKTWRGRVMRHIFPSVWNHHQSRIVRFLCRRFYNILGKYKLKTSKVAYPYGGEGITEFFWKSFLGEPIIVHFNGGEFYAPKNYHEILSAIYGDYLKLPPEEDRHPYHGASCFCWKVTKE